MKTNFKIFISLILLLGIFTTSCVKHEFDEPEIPNPDEITSGLTPNITIQGLIDKYNNGGLIDTVGTIKIVPDSGYVLEAVVVSNDAYGNFYKEIYMQDENNGVYFSIDGSNLFNDYKVGQTVHIKLAGLYVDYDSFSAILKIGFGLYNDNGTTKLGRIPASILPDYLFNNKAPKAVEPITITLDNMNDSYAGRYVKIENCQFIDSDTSATYAIATSNPPQNLSLNLEQCGATNHIVLRTSGYALFAGKNVPNGNGTIEGVFTKYGTTYQLKINNDSDVNFESSRCDDGGSGGSGDGTKDNPYSVDYAIANNSGTGVWVKGYIVGVIETGGTAFEANLTAPFSTNSNIYIAPTADETDTTKMLIVQLPSGNIRTATNLVDHSDLLGSEIMYYGDLMPYFNVAGMKNTTGYWLNGNGIDPGYVDPNTIWSVNFDTDLEGFTTVDSLGAETWAQSSYNGVTYAKMTGYNGGHHANVDWLVSPSIDLSGHSNVKFSINQAVNYLDTWDHIKIYITDNYTGDVNTTSWTEINLTTKPSGSDWNFVTSEDYDISAFDNQSNVVIAFKYTSTDSAGSTWEIDKVVIKE